MSGKNPVLDTPHPGDESVHHTLIVRSLQAKVGSESHLLQPRLRVLSAWSAFKTGTFASPLMLIRKLNIHHSSPPPQLCPPPPQNNKKKKKGKHIALNSGKGFRVVKMQKSVSQALPTR